MTTPILADFFAHYSHEYEILGYIMLFFLFATHLLWVWMPERANRQQGYCILLFGVVVAYAELWLLSACNLDPEDVLGIREPLRPFWGSPKLVDRLSFCLIFLLWIFISYRGGKVIHQLLVRMGLLSDEE